MPWGLVKLPPPKNQHTHTHQNATFKRWRWMVMVLSLTSFSIMRLEVKGQCTSCPNLGSPFSITTCNQTMAGSYDQSLNENKEFATPGPVCCSGAPETCPKEKYTFCFNGLTPGCQYNICFVRIDNIDYGAFSAVSCPTTASGKIDYTNKNNYLASHFFTKICVTVTADNTGSACGTACIPLYGTWLATCFANSYNIQNYEYYLGGVHFDDDRLSETTCLKATTASFDDITGTTIAGTNGYKAKGKVFHNTNPNFYNPPPGQNCPQNINPCLCD